MKGEEKRKDKKGGQKRKERKGGLKIKEKKKLNSKFTASALFAT